MSAPFEIAAPQRILDLWQQPLVMPPLPQAAIHVWRLRPEARLPDEIYVQYLQGEEVDRANRFLFVEDRRQWIATRATLRLLLSHYAGTGDGRALEFSTSPLGKPSLTNSDIQFNLSHTRGLAVFVFARGFEVGVDVEYARDTSDLDDVAAQNFAPAECAALHALPAAERTSAFYRCWTRKEALLKAEGNGLFRALDSFAVPVSTAANAERVIGAPEGWELTHLDVSPDAPGAVAWRNRQTAPAIALFDWLPAHAPGTTVWHASSSGHVGPS